MDTKNIRREFNLTQKEFSVIFDIPYSTVRNWDARNCMPLYVCGMVDKILFYRLRAFRYDLLLFPDNKDLTNEQIKEEFIEMLKEEAETFIRFEKEKAQ